MKAEDPVGTQRYKVCRSEYELDGSELNDQIALHLGLEVDLDLIISKNFKDRLIVFENLLKCVRIQFEDYSAIRNGNHAELENFQNLALYLTLIPSPGLRDESNSSVMRIKLEVIRLIAEYTLTPLPENLLTTAIISSASVMGETKVSAHCMDTIIALAEASSARYVADCMLEILNVSIECGPEDDQKTVVLQNRSKLQASLNGKTVFHSQAATAISVMIERLLLEFGIHYGVGDDLYTVQLDSVIAVVVHLVVRCASRTSLAAAALCEVSGKRDFVVFTVDEFLKNSKNEWANEMFKSALSKPKRHMDLHSYPTRSMRFVTESRTATESQNTAEQREFNLQIRNDDTVTATEFSNTPYSASATRLQTPNTLVVKHKAKKFSPSTQKSKHNECSNETNDISPKKLNLADESVVESETDSVKESNNASMADLLKDITPKLNDKNWKLRQNALTTTELILKTSTMFIHPAELDAEFLNALVNRVRDPNKSLACLSWECLGRLAGAISRSNDVEHSLSKASAETVYSKVFTVGFADSRATVQEASIRCLNTWCRFRIGHVWLALQFIPLALITENSSLRQVTLDWTLKFLNSSNELKHADIPSLEILVEGTLLCLRDRTSDVRKKSELLMELIVRRNGFDCVTFKLQQLPKPVRMHLGPSIEKFKGMESESTSTQTNEREINTNIALKSPVSKLSQAGKDSSIKGVPALKSIRKVLDILSSREVSDMNCIVGRRKALSLLCRAAKHESSFSEKIVSRSLNSIIDGLVRQIDSSVCIIVQLDSSDSDYQTQFDSAFDWGESHCCAMFNLVVLLNTNGCVESQTVVNSIVSMIQLASVTARSKNTTIQCLAHMYVRKVIEKVSCSSRVRFQVLLHALENTSSKEACVLLVKEIQSYLNFTLKSLQNEELQNLFGILQQFASKWLIVSSQDPKMFEARILVLRLLIERFIQCSEMNLSEAIVDLKRCEFPILEAFVLFRQEQRNLPIDQTHEIPSTNDALAEVKSLESALM